MFMIRLQSNFGTGRGATISQLILGRMYSDWTCLRTVRLMFPCNAREQKKSSGIHWTIPMLFYAHTPTLTQAFSRIRLSSAAPFHMDEPHTRLIHRQLTLGPHSTALTPRCIYKTTNHTRITGTSIPVFKWARYRTVRFESRSIHSIHWGLSLYGFVVIAKSVCGFCVEKRQSINDFPKNISRNIVIYIR